MVSSSAAQDREGEDDHPSSDRGFTESQVLQRQPGVLLPPALHQRQPETGAHRVPQQRSSQPAVRHQEGAEAECQLTRQRAESSGEEETSDVNVLPS